MEDQSDVIDDKEQTHCSSVGARNITVLDKVLNVLVDEEIVTNYCKSTVESTEQHNIKKITFFKCLECGDDSCEYKNRLIARIHLRKQHFGGIDVDLSEEQEVQLENSIEIIAVSEKTDDSANDVGTGEETIRKLII